jgi:hypothetical protein
MKGRLTPMTERERVTVLRVQISSRRALVLSAPRVARRGMMIQDHAVVSQRLRPGYVQVFAAGLSVATWSPVHVIVRVTPWSKVTPAVVVSWIP